MIQIEECTDQTRWDSFVLEHGGHPLQLWGWGAVKESHNWQPYRLFVHDDDEIIGAAQVLKRKLPWPFRALLYIPRGPVGEERQDELYGAIAAYAKRHIGGVVLSSEPHQRKALTASGWRVSHNQILIPQTLIIDLAQSEGTLLAQMAKKTRQYIRKSAREGGDIRQVTQRSEVAKCLEIYKDTAKRAHFALHDDTYYYDVFDSLDENSVIFAAYEGETMIAFVWLATSESVAFELYGGVTDRGQELRANYSLKWHAMQTFKRWGVAQYDVNGLLNDGISTFKRGFSDHEDTLVGTYDYPLSVLYTAWSVLLPKMRAILRRFK